MIDPFESRPALVTRAEVKAEANKFSRSTRAHINVVKDQLIETKKSMLNDMSRCQFPTQQDVVSAIMDLQAIQQNLDRLEKKVVANIASGFSPTDIETMRAMKRNGVVETEIAHRFCTNQTKVNRLLNGIALPDET